DGVWWEGRIIGPPTAGYLRLHLVAIQNAGVGGYRLVIRGANEKKLLEYEPSSFDGRTELYTGLVFSHVAVVQIVGRKNNSPKGFGFTIDSFSHAVDVRDRLKPQSILPTWKPLDEISSRFPARAFVESVAKLHMGDGAVCTGFLLGPDLLLTNYHCLAHSTMFDPAVPLDAAKCSDIQALFDFDTQGAPNDVVTRECRRVLAGKDVPFDYALLQIAPEKRDV